eukprot:TRINITY_DN138_c1_g1_i3.p1 TRINITY_DN138_c1_g1~~TRINITY_DN138_c1_g1_i3.p1  ORF type:complete len:911 (+),score=347.05 TRINITY_DN138_c1_g1_i3:45-2777(+)
MAKAKEPMMSDVSPSRSRSPHRRARAARDAADAAEQATLGEQQQVQQHVQPSVEEESDETGPDDACEEPVLKYQRMQADVGAMLAAGDRVTRVALHDDYLALGTETGAIYLTDFHGNLSRRLRPHRGAVHDISIDASGEFVASCSQDGTVVVTSLQHDNGGGGSGAGADRAAAGIPPRGGNRRLTPPLAAQPEVQLVRRATGEVLAADTLPLNGWQNNLAGHYCMASTSWSPGAIRWPRGKAAQAAAASAMHINTAAAAAATVATAATTAGLPPALFIAAPQDLVVARVRDVDDSVAWALQRGDAGAAVRVALRNRHSLRTHSYRDLVARRLEELMGEGRYEAAAAETPLLLGADTAAWEQWIYAFARRGRLDAIAPHVPPLPVQEGGGEALPAASLRLAGSVYMLILEHLLTAKPPLFLETVRRWGHPRDAAAAARRAEVSAAETAASAPSRQAQGSIAAKELYSLSLLMAAIESALRARLDAHVLEAQAELLLLDRQFERAVGAYLTMARVRAAAAAAARAEEDDGASTLGDGAAYSGGGGGGGGGSSEVAPRTAAHVFKLIEQHSLFRAIQGRVLELIQLSQADAGALLVRHVDKLPASQVVPQLRGRRDLQHWYLHLLFTQAPELYNTPEHAQFHALQVSLYAQFAPPFQPRRPPPYDSDFLRFLRGSAFAPLEAALTECEKRRPPLWDEMVFVLGRLGRTQRALSVLLEEVDCARRAIEFVGAHDKDLWYRLIDYSLRNERFLGGLLDHAGVYDVDLAGLIRGVPEGMRIQGLREKLGKITSDYRFQVTLHETCLSSLRSDHLAKLRRLNQMRRRALRVGGGGSSSCSARACCVAEPSPPASAHAQCTPGRGIAASGGLRVFACGHSFHEACLKPQAGLRGGPQRGGSCPVCAGSGGALSGALAL